MPDENGQLPQDNGTPLAPPEEARPGTETRLQGESVFDAAPTPDTLEEKYRGKSVADIAKMHKEAEAALGKQSGELGTLRKQMDEQNRALQQLQWERALATQQQQAAQPTPPPQPRPAPDYPAPNRFDWEKPEQSAAQIADYVASQRMRQMYHGIQTEQARQIAPMARDMAMRSRPDLFRGIEDKVEMAMDAGVRNGWIRPADITNPKSWEMVAWQLQGVQNQYRIPNAVNPVSPTMTETPAGIRSNIEETEDVSMEPDLRDAIRKGWREDPEKVAKAIAEDRKAAKKRR